MPSEALAAVPHLTTALDGPLQQLESQLLTQQPAIEAWLRRQWASTRAPFYSSVDLRNAGFKLAPVDTNLFPAGFNNLNPSFLPLCIQAIQSAVENLCPTAANILLIPESHTRNLFYLESVATLAGILRQAGFQVRVGGLDLPPAAPQEHALPSGSRWCRRSGWAGRTGSSRAISPTTPRSRRSSPSWSTSTRGCSTR